MGGPEIGVWRSRGGGCLEVGGVWRWGVWRWGEVWRCEGLEVEVWRSGGGSLEVGGLSRGTVVT